MLKIGECYIAELPKINKKGGISYIPLDKGSGDLSGKLFGK